MDCDGLCATCTNETTCLTCKTGVPNRSTVLPCNCNDGYYEDDSKTC